MSNPRPATVPPSCLRPVTLLKAKQAGEVGYHLYAYSGGPV